jgi:ubiquinone/menaquinone biosynthesis C-methylase UbiE
VVTRDVTTERVRAVYERIAPGYDTGMGWLERLLRVDDGRRWIAARAAGDTLEIGVGTGLNLTFYGPEVSLTGLDLARTMLAEARKKAMDLGRAVSLVEGNAEALPFPDGRFDTVVFGLCLCSIPDDERAVREGGRVLRPTGRLLLLEHVRSPTLPVRTVQRALEPLSVRFQADHLVRQPLDAVRAAGLEIDEVERWALGVMEAASASKPLR